MNENGQATENEVAATATEQPVQETHPATEPTQVLEGTEGTQPEVNATLEPIIPVPTVEATQPPETISPEASKTEEQLPPPVVTTAPPVEEITEDESQRIEAAVIDKSAVANFIVDAIEGNGAHEKSKEGCTLRLVPIETTETKAFFKSFPPVLHIGVVNPEVAAKFKVGGKVSLILLNEE